VQFPIGAVLQHSNTPSLRVAGFEDEDDDEDENEAPHEWRPKTRFLVPGKIFADRTIHIASSAYRAGSGVGYTQT
jgi:hypothetical protein